MNVLIFLGSLNSGGTENLFLDVLKNRTKIKEINFFLVSRKGGKLQEDFIEAISNYTKISLNDLKSIIKLRRFVKENEIQVVHANQALDVLKLRFALIFLKVKIIYSIHHFDHSMSKKHLFSFKIALKMAHQLIFVSDFQKKYFELKYKIKKTKINMLYNGVNFNKFDTPSEKITFRSELKINQETILICSVGNFVSGRNQLLICKFAKLLKASNVDFKLVFVGQKNEDKFTHYKDSYSFCQVNNLLNEVSFLGSRSDVAQILKSSDVFIYSSGHDSFGIAVIEALYSMNNVFLNDWPVMREISNHGTFATIFATNDENDLFSKFNSNFEENKHISQTEKVKFLMANFSIEQHLLGLEKIYKNLSK